MADGSRESKYRSATKEQATEETRPLGHRDRVKAGRYDGRTSWEAYRAKFQMVAQANGWNQAEKAVQLAAALEGEALRALLDLSDEELADYRAVVTALDHRFGGTEPATSLRQRLASRTRHSGEKLGVFAAEIRYLTRKGYPHFAAEVQEDLATEAFLRGLTPDALRRHVRLTAPASLELALSQAKMVEEVLEENPLNRALEGGPLGEAYQAKFQMVAQANGWNQAEKAVQLAAALEGEALRALLDLRIEELADYWAVVTALDHRFGGTEPATSLCQRLASRTCHSGEKLGVFAA
ncbi:UNVERIFIED_CONTAM: hypothetical protein FKN15_020471 [Acipenser sinensis]